MLEAFADRRDAGRQLAATLRHLAGRSDLVVLGLPRGGVPVAYEVARELGAPLDVFVVRKLGVPLQPEYAMGAVATGGVRVLNRDVIDALRIPTASVEAVAAAELWELGRRERAYRESRPYPTLGGATVLLVDDGVATGASMLAAVQALRTHHPASVIVATPVISSEAHATLAAAADAVVSVAMPRPFYGVGAWYRDFAQTTDAEVRSLLGTAAVEHRKRAQRLHHA